MPKLGHYFFWLDLRFSLCHCFWFVCLFVFSFTMLSMWAFLKSIYLGQKIYILVICVLMCFLVFRKFLPSISLLLLMLSSFYSHLWDSNHTNASYRYDDNLSFAFSIVPPSYASFWVFSSDLCSILIIFFSVLYNLQLNTLSFAF